MNKRRRFRRVGRAKLNPAVSKPSNFDYILRQMVGLASLACGSLRSTHPTFFDFTNGGFRYILRNQLFEGMTAREIYDNAAEFWNNAKSSWNVDKKVEKSNDS